MPSRTCDVILDEIQAAPFRQWRRAMVTASAAILPMTDSTIACMSATVFREFSVPAPRCERVIVKQFSPASPHSSQRVNEFSSISQEQDLCRIVAAGAARFH
jgi:hypothetical protein